jgi:thiol-disulfide isomerase/thioredoxin
MKKIFNMVLLLVALIQTVNAQQNIPVYPKIGEKCPDFTFTDVEDFPVGKRSISDFRGKWLILDFWSVGCSGCVASFPKMNKLQKDFSDKLQIIMIGYNARPYPDVVKPSYKLYKKKDKLDFAVAYDSVNYKRFSLGSFPCLVVINPEGIIKAYTNSIDADKLLALIKNKPANLLPYLGRTEEVKFLAKGYDRKQLLLANENRGNDSNFLYLSLLSKWSSETPYNVVQGLNTKYVRTPHPSGEQGKLEALGITLKGMFLLASLGQTAGWSTKIQNDLYGKASEQIIFKNKDSTSLKAQLYSKQKFCYSLKVPQSQGSNEYLQKKMLMELASYFNVTAAVEKVKVKALKLVIVDEALFLKHASKDQQVKPRGEPVSKIMDSGLMMHNATTEEMMDWIRYYLSESGYEFIINATRKDLKLDVEFNCFLKDFNQIKKAYNGFGVDLVEDTIEVDALVIRDPK